MPQALYLTARVCGAVTHGKLVPDVPGQEAALADPPAARQHQDFKRVMDHDAAFLLLLARSKGFG